MRGKNHGTYRKLGQKRRSLLAKVQRWCIHILLIHVLIIFIKDIRIGPFELVREWILTFVWEGSLAKVVQPVCRWFWSLPFYPFLWKMTGVPMAAIFLVAAVLRWKAGKVKADVGTDMGNSYGQSLRAGGRYRNPGDFFWKKAVRFFHSEAKNGEYKNTFQKEQKQLKVARVISAVGNPLGEFDLVMDIRRKKIWCAGTAIFRKIGEPEKYGCLRKLEVRYDPESGGAAVYFADTYLALLEEGDILGFEVSQKKEEIEITEKDRAQFFVMML